jgi:hypothetical protein
VVGVATTMVIGASSASAQDYGLDTCLQGYVWREAMASDHVCVTRATRSQAWSDNAQAANRRASLNIWITRWYPTANCGEGCSTSDAGVAHMKINGDHFNIGDRVWLGYYQLNSRRLIQGYWVNATPHPNFPGGSFGRKTDMLDCGKGAATAYIRAYDQTSGRWSSQLNIHTGCVHP